MRFSLPIKPGQAFDFSGEEADGTLGTVKHVLSENMLYDAVARVYREGTAHCGYKKAATILKREFYGIPRQFVQEICKSCPTCEKTQPQTCCPPPF